LSTHCFNPFGAAEWMHIKWKYGGIKLILQSLLMAHTSFNSCNKEKPLDASSDINNNKMQDYGSSSGLVQISLTGFMKAITGPELCYYTPTLSCSNVSKWVQQFLSKDIISCFQPIWGKLNSDFHDCIRACSHSCSTQSLLHKF
jgi:hypothetical protein